MAFESTLDFNSEAFRNAAYRHYATLRDVAPVFLSQPPGQLPIWYVTGAREVETVLLDSERFARDPGRISAQFAAMMGGEQAIAFLNEHMLNRDGEQHRRLRRLVNKAFTLKAVNTLRPRIEQIAETLLDQVGPEGHMDVVKQFAFPLSIIVIAELLGVPAQDRDDFRRWSQLIVQQVGHDLSALQRCYGEFAHYMLALVEQRRASPGDDLVSALVQVEEEGKALSDSELCSMIALLIVAGHETAASMIGNAVYLLVQHPQALWRLRDDPRSMPAAVEELLRYDCSVERAMVRFVTRDTELAGQSLQRGQLLMAVVGSANRDPALCERPDTFDITRAACPHLSFGKGAHHCLGASLARQELEIALNTLLRRCPELRLAVAADAVQWRYVPNFRGPRALPVCWSVNGHGG
ncbi:cytochrome P450 [Pseudomonas sp. S75]|uniref:cytochrome P450 family protein n=1 Tax=unclassified Pseudomonas TaxID=196821 RepID=UPI0019043439|nr:MULTISPECIES: cytochrome P450 [unclassified Pseudomonas]MBJ9977922.1 cytochrome P450 [Pseudomonas sp. S30]MBK0155872.1 cytochrome P450 [Pseudomonas sp. S75]